MHLGQHPFPQALFLESLIGDHKKSTVQCVGNHDGVSAQLCLDSQRPYGLWPARLLCPGDFTGENTAAGCHFPCQGSYDHSNKKISLPFSMPKNTESGKDFYFFLFVVCRVTIYR